MKGTLLSFDPGETTGWAVFTHDDNETWLIEAGQIKTWPLEEGVKNITTLLDIYTPKHIVFESYHIYSWKADEHKYSEVATIQVIGAIRTLAILRQITNSFQSAQLGKGFCTDQKLESWGLWLEGLRHARDAIRHGAYYLLFGATKQK